MDEPGDLGRQDAFQLLGRLADDELVVGDSGAVQDARQRPVRAPDMVQQASDGDPVGHVGTLVVHRQAGRAQRFERLLLRRVQRRPPSEDDGGPFHGGGDLLAMIRPRPPAPPVMR